MKFASRLKVTASSLGSTTLNPGTLVNLGSAFTNCRTLAQAISDGSNDSTAIKVGDSNVPFAFDDGSSWMDAYCTIMSTTQIRVDQVISSSSGTIAPTFPGAMPTVYNTVPGDFLRRVAIDTYPATFSTTVPLTQIGTVHMPRQMVNGNLTFTAMAGAVRGAMAEYILILDGTSTITMSGFTEHGSSAGLLNTSGMSNTVFFWYDGYTYWWSASQAANPVAQDIVAPTVSSGSVAVANATPATVTLTASEALDTNYTPAASAFTVTGHTVLSVSISGSTINLTVSPAFVNGETSTVMYTQPATNGVRDLVGNLMATFPSALSITDNVSATATGLSMTGPTSGTVGTASSNFTVALAPVGSSFAGTDTVTPSDGGAGGTFNPTSFPLTQASPSATFTYTAASSGAKTISISDSSGLTKPSNITFTASATATAPDAPTIGTATPGDTTATVTWTAPANNGGSAITGYTITGYNASTNASVGTTTAGANATSTTFTGLTDGTSYYFKVAATNSVGTGAQSAQSNTVIPAAAGYYPKLLQTTNVTESGTGPYTYTGNGSSLSTATNGGILSKSLAAGVDGYLEFKVPSTGDIIVGLRAQNTQSGYNGDVVALFITTGNAYYKLVNGVNSSLSANMTAGDICRVKRVGTLHKLQKAPAADPTNFTDLYSYDYGSSPQMWFQVHAYESASVQLTAASGVS
jgi:hypothetical protein